MGATRYSGHCWVNKHFGFWHCAAWKFSGFWQKYLYRSSHPVSINAAKIKIYFIP
jgi:hypothetical protein